MKLINLSILGLLIIAGDSWASRECKTSRGLTIAQQLANLEIETKLMPDYDFFSGGHIAAGYEYEVEPAFTNGLYFRTDRWQLTTKYLLDEVKDISIGLNNNLRAGPEFQTEATFIRLFNDPCRALLTSPYGLKRAPLNVAVATGPYFHKGDYFLLKGSLGFVASSELLQMFGNAAWGANIGAGIFMKGEFQLHIVKLDDKSVRLKVIGHRERSASGSAGVGFKGAVNLFKVRPIDKQVKKLFGEPIKLEIRGEKDKVLMVDYILDLSDKEVGEGFERILTKIKNFGVLAMANPFKTDSDLERNLVLDLTPLEDIYRADYQAGKVGRLKRNLRASSGQGSYGFKIDIGNSILGWKFNTGVSTSRMSVKQDDDTLESYLMRAWDSGASGRFFFSWSRSSHDDGFRSLFKTDDKFNIERPVNMVQFHNKKKNRLNKKGFADVKNFLKRVLPAEVENEIPWSDWEEIPENQNYTNFGMRYQLILSPEVIINAPQLSMNGIKILFRDHIKSKGLLASDFYPETQDGSESNPQGQFEASLHEFAKKLSKSLDQDVPHLERLEAFTSLRNNKLFKESGLSFIMAIRPEMMSKWFNLDLNLSSNETRLDYSYGNPNMSALYKKLITIKAALDDEAYDLLREAESISFPKLP